MSDRQILTSYKTRLNDRNTGVSKLPICIWVYYFNNLWFVVFSEAFSSIFWELDDFWKWRKRFLVEINSKRVLKQSVRYDMGGTKIKISTGWTGRNDAPLEFKSVTIDLLMIQVVIQMIGIIVIVRRSHMDKPFTWSRGFEYLRNTPWHQTCIKDLNKLPNTFR